MNLVLDIGGTNIRIAEVNGKTIKKKIIVNTPKDKTKLLKQIDELIGKYKKPERIGVGLAGLIGRGVIKTPHLPLNDFDLKKYLQNKYKVKVAIENDAKCAAIAEKHYGLGKNKKNFIFLTLGTGIGGAIFIDGKLYKGNSFAGEFGHMQIPGGEYESISSGSAARKLAVKKGLGNIIGEDVVRAAKKGNKEAIAVLEEIGKNLSFGLINIIYAFDPEVIILGGGFAEIPVLYKIIKKNIEKMDIIKRKIKIVHSKLGDEAGLIGAGLLK